MMRKARRGQSRIQSNSSLYRLYEYGLLLAGAFVVAASFNLFLNPNQIVSGGVAGISTIAEHVFGFEPAIVQWALNIPIFLAGWWLLGGGFGLKTVLGSIILPFFVLLTSSWSPPTPNLLLAAIYGGIGVGAGIGLVFRGRGSTGGLDTAAQILHKYTGLSLGMALAIFDGAVIVSAGIIFTPEKALYALIGLFVTAKTIDVMQVGFSTSKVAYIISDKAEQLQPVILQDLDRGLTRLHGYGGYTGEQKNVLMVVVAQREIAKLKGLVRSVDPHAFMILSDASEVLGEGFKIGNP
ncbi:UPF0750 membrane protein YvjA [Xylanibacillus composti]|uniref:UPF0750 membrane protein YvjA n=1 Tax=Xylanibacillus composti TaxID=1572762 RepID=A0A8J4H751_9BACL|nr:YitT family protein [Xylanibacillus composti]GIQ69998.1 UPF0750 membrane protein YvjA [Xylanibacillus composti]